MNQTLYVSYNNKKVPVIISECSEKEFRDKWWVHIFCAEANLDQDHMMEDLWGLLTSLPSLIAFQKENKKAEVIRLRVSPEEKARMEKLASNKWYSSLSAYIRNKALA